MAINKATLAKEIDGVIEYIYPKTTADLVEYDASYTVEEKIKQLEKNITGVNDRVSNLTTGIGDGSITSVLDAELLDIRIPNAGVVGTEVKYASAGDAVRGQVGKLSDEIGQNRSNLSNVKGKVDTLEKIVSSIQGTAGNSNAEVVGLRVPNSKISELTYQNAGEAVRAQLGILFDKIIATDAKISTMQNAFQGGEVSSAEGLELVDIRTPSYNVVPEGTTYKTAGEAVRAQMDALNEKIEEVKDGTYYELLYVNGEPLYTSDGEPILVSISYNEVGTSDISALEKRMRQELKDTLAAHTRIMQQTLNVINEGMETMQRNIDMIYTGKYCEPIMIDGDEWYTSDKQQIVTYTSVGDLAQEAIDRTAQLLRGEIYQAKVSCARALKDWVMDQNMLFLVNTEPIIEEVTAS